MGSFCEKKKEPVYYRIRHARWLVPMCWLASMTLSDKIINWVRLGPVELGENDKPGSASTRYNISLSQVIRFNDQNQFNDDFKST